MSHLQEPETGEVRAGDDHDARDAAAAMILRLGRTHVLPLSLLKLPSGALSALVGLLFVHGEFIPGLSQLDNQPQLLAYAFTFGIAQQVITGAVDKNAQEILNKVPSKEPVSTTPQASPAVGPIPPPAPTEPRG